MKDHKKILLFISIFIFIFPAYSLKLSQAEENNVKDETVEELKKFAEMVFKKEKSAERETDDIKLTQYHKYKLIEQADRLSSETTNLREKLRYFAIYGLIAGAIITLFLIMFRIKNTKHSPDDILNATGLIFIIFGTIIVVIIADVGEQLTAAVGVLGAIAGYLFGTLRKSKE